MRCTDEAIRRDAAKSLGWNRKHRVWDLLGEEVEKRVAAKSSSSSSDDDGKKRGRDGDESAQPPAKRARIGKKEASAENE
jgi:hypothetical protein